MLCFCISLDTNKIKLFIVYIFFFAVINILEREHDDDVIIELDVDDVTHPGHANSIGQELGEKTSDTDFYRQRRIIGGILLFISIYLNETSWKSELEYHAGLPHYKNLS